MRCDSNFNFKKKIREHVRKQYIKKSINCFFFNRYNQINMRNRKKN